MNPIRLKLMKGGKEGELIAQGWTKQTTIGEPRLSEIVDNYRSMGYEVHVIEHPLDPSGATCTSCFSVGAEIGQTCADIYTRPRGHAKALADDLF